MKKLIGLCVVSALLLGFMGCGGRATAPDEAVAPPEESMPDPGEMAEDGGDPGSGEPKAP